MGHVSLPTLGPDPGTCTLEAIDDKVDPLATEFNGGIDNDNIDSGANIAASKLNLATIAQSMAMSSKDFSEAKGANVASATTTEIWVTDGNFIHITGTTTITSFGTAGQAGDERTIVFDGILTLTHNATSLILPGATNITTAAGDRAIVRAETTTNARVIVYTKADGTAVVATSVPSAASQAEMETGSSTSVYVTPGRIQYHPGVAKAWGVFDGSGTPAYAASYNMDSSITDGGAGLYTVSFATDFSSANYAMAGLAKSTGNVLMDVSIKSDNTPGAGSVQLSVRDGADNPADSTRISFVAFGDQ